MEGVALAVMLPPWSYKSELLTPKPKAYHHLPYRRSPSSPRRQTGINRPVLWRTAFQADGLVVCYLHRGRCPRLLIVVPSRHRSACGMRVIWIPSRHRSACGFYFITDLTDLTDLTVRGDCALMRPIGLGEYVTGICSRRVLAFPSDRLTHILPLAGHHKSTIITNATHVL